MTKTLILLVCMAAAFDFRLMAGDTNAPLPIQSLASPPGAPSQMPGPTNAPPTNAVKMIETATIPERTNGPAKPIDLQSVKAARPASTNAPPPPPPQPTFEDGVFYGVAMAQRNVDIRGALLVQLARLAWAHDRGVK